MCTELRQNDSDDLAHYLPHRGQEAARAVPRHHAALDDDKLGQVREVGAEREDDFIHGEPVAAEGATERDPDGQLPGAPDDVQVRYQGSRPPRVPVLGVRLAQVKQERQALARVLDHAGGAGEARVPHPTMGADLRRLSAAGQERQARPTGNPLAPGVVLCSADRRTHALAVLCGVLCRGGVGEEAVDAGQDSRGQFEAPALAGDGECVPGRMLFTVPSARGEPKKSISYSPLSHCAQRSRPTSQYALLFLRGGQRDVSS